MSKAFTNEDMDALCKRMDDTGLTLEEALEIIAKADALYKETHDELQ